MASNWAKYFLESIEKRLEESLDDISKNTLEITTQQ